MFTIGQKDRMRAALNSSISGRNNLWQESNLIQTGVMNSSDLAICTPIVDFISDVNEGCEGLTVNFTDRTYNSDIDESWIWNWSFPGGSPSSSGDKNPAVTYFNAGWYNVSLSVSNSAGDDSYTVERKIRVVSDSSGFFAPFHESFENASFPYHQTDENMDWSIINAGSDNWEITQSASASGDYSIRINNRYNSPGTKNTFISPPINISNFTEHIGLFFKLAYAKRNVDSRDKLMVYYSKNCGETWSVGMIRTANSLVSNNGSFVSYSFIPNSSQWKEFSSDLDNCIGYESIRLKFICESDGGNYMYIDDIMVTEQSNSKLIEFNGFYADVFPNPSENNANLIISEIKEKSVSVEIITPTGEIISTNNYPTENNNLQIKLDSDNNKGLFFIKISGLKYSKTIKWVVL
jgi:PKD repeat protein